MSTLLRLFVDMALWRKGPQDLPASISLALVLAVTYSVTGYIQVRLLGYVAPAARVLTLIDIGTLCTLMTALLSAMGRRARLLQTLTAVLGVGTLLGVIDIIVRGVIVYSSGSNDEPLVWSLLQLLLILLVVGRILMHALETGLLTGVAATFAIVLTTEAVARIFVQMPPGAATS